MYLKDILEELREEARKITTKSLPPIGLDYRGRTKLERLLFLVVKECCQEQFGYELGGMSYSHQKYFYEAAQKSWSEKGMQTVEEGFRLADLIRDIASSDPYVAEVKLSKLGGTEDKLLQNLRNQICEFVSSVVDLMKKS